MKDYADFGISVSPGAKGEVKTLCPKCSANRKKPHDKCLNVNTEKETWNCKNCGWAGALSSEVSRSTFTPRKNYDRPKMPILSDIAANWAEWFQKRGILPEVYRRNGVYTAPHFVPQLGKAALCVHFPYYRGGELVNIKHRDSSKNFSQEKNAEPILYGHDDIAETTIWVEGEMDKLSLEVAGYRNCVSVPSGAPNPGEKNLAKRFEFLENCQEAISTIKTHILATDKDGPGYKLQEELIRRLGAENCSVAVWPDGCKDANDCLVKFGAAAIREVISAAKQCPIKGIVSVGDIADSLFSVYEHGTQAGMPTGWASVDEFYTVRPGEWTVVTGIPGHGKSEWLDALVLNLAANHGWTFAVFSPENQPLVEHAKKLLEKIVGKPFAVGYHERMTPDELVSATAWLDERFRFILPEEPTMDEILSLGEKMVRRHGINGMIVDPWNELDHNRPGNMTETEYVSHAISKFRRFARKNQIHLWVVAHPTKLRKDEKTGRYPVPTLYDISGSAHWRNKADNGIAVYRHIDDQEKPVEIYVQKIRFKAVGKVGMTALKYDRVTGRYYETE